MPSLVEMQYNPYLPQVDWLIDGRQPTGFSRLIQYSDEDIWLWCSKVLDTIYDEIKDDYLISFTGMDQDGKILKHLCEKEEHCIGFRKRDFILSDSLQTRMGLLNKLIRSAEISVYEKTIIDAVFVIDPALEALSEEIRALDINNLFCSVKVRRDGLKTIYEEDDKSVLFIIAGNDTEGCNYRNHFRNKRPAYILIPGEINEVVNVTDRGWFIRVKADDMVAEIFNCFLQMPLRIAFRRCVKSIHGGNKITRELERLSSIEPVVRISVGKEVEVGRSIKVNASLEPEGGKLPMLLYKMRNGDVASCDGINVYGVKEGVSILEVYKEGSSKPLFVKEIKVVKRNRVTRLILSDDSLVMGLNDKGKIQLDYYPSDADNAGTIAWRSSNANIVAVDHQGRIEAVGTGNCRIICTAENVSAQCMCTVKPYMKDLQIEGDGNGCIYLNSMQERKLVYNCIPEDCLDSKLIITSSDSDIVNVVGKTLYAKKAGKAFVTIGNQSGKVRRTIEVIVSGKEQGRKKAGFFKSLFS